MKVKGMIPKGMTPKGMIPKGTIPKGALAGRVCTAPVFAAALSTALLGCFGPTRYMRGGGQVQALTVHAVDWNPARSEVGHVAAVADDGDDVVVFGDRGALFLTSGAVVAADRRFTAWRGAAAIPAADRKDTWLVGVEEHGQLYRAKARSTLESISDRYGLADREVKSLVALGGGFLGLSLGGSAPGPAAAEPLFALADGRTVTTFRPGVGAASSIAGGGGKAAWIASATIRVFDPQKKTDRTYSLPGAAFVALDASGKLHAATAHEIYAEDAGSTLALLYETASPQATITSLVASGPRVWFTEDTDLGTIESGRVAVTTDLHAAPKGTLSPSPSGDVWALSAGALARYTRTAPTDARRARWDAAIRPVLARSCMSCHGPVPSSGIDLSTFDAWESQRATIRSRVVDLRDMPPRGRSLEEEERRAIEAWTAPAP
jgi:mono/diheme cytochrome c family protein